MKNKTSLNMFFIGMIFGALFYLSFFSNLVIKNFEPHNEAILEIMFLMLSIGVFGSTFHSLAEWALKNFSLKDICLFSSGFLSLSAISCLTFVVITYLHGDLPKNEPFMKLVTLWMVINFGLMVFFLEAKKIFKKNPMKWVE